MFMAGSSLKLGGVLNGSHIVRWNYSYKNIISNCLMIDPGGARECIKLCNITYDQDALGSQSIPESPPSKKLAGDPANHGGGGTRYVVISDSYFGHLTRVGTTVDSMINVLDPAHDSDGRGRDVIIERSWFVASDGTTQRAIWSSWSNTTYRNNLFDFSGAKYAQGIISIAKWWTSTDANKPAVSPSTGPVPDGVYIYNNTFYCSTNRASFSAVMFNDVTPINVNIRNNLAYAPLDTYHKMVEEIVASPAAYVNTNNSPTVTAAGKGVQVDPLFIGALSTVTNWAVSSGSYAKNTGADVPVWSDFFGNNRVNGSMDIGAFEQ